MTGMTKKLEGDIKPRLETSIIRSKPFPHVTLVLPRSKVHRSSAISMAGAEHLGLSYITSYLRSQGVSVQLLNFQLAAFFNVWDGLTDERQSYEPEDLAEEIITTKPDIVGFCVTSMTLASALAMSRIIKQKHPNCIVGLGGPHAILCADELFQRFFHIDFIGLNDGERSMKILVDAVERGEWPYPVPEMLVRGVGATHRLNNVSGTSLSRDIDDLPAPARDDLLSMVIRTPVTEARLSTSRGCNYQCAFCIDAMRYERHWYARSAEQIIDEIELLHKCLGINHFWISDDNFLTGAKGSRRRAAAIADGLIERGIDITYRARFRSDTFVKEPELLPKLAQSGLISAFIGLEAGSESQLERFNKNTSVEQHKQIVADLRRNGVALQIGFIMFEPYSTFDDILESAKFLYELDEMYVIGNFIQSLDVFPGAGMTDTMKQDGLLDPDFGAISNYDAYQFKDTRIGKLAKYLELCHDEETITRDKGIYRYRTNLVPRIFRKLKASGKTENLTKWMAHEQAIITDLNEVNYIFFKNVAEVAYNNQPEQVFDVEKERAWSAQIKLLEQYTTLYEEIQGTLEPPIWFAPSDIDTNTKITLPKEIQQKLDESLGYIKGGNRAKIEVLAGGNLNYTVKILTTDSTFVFRCRRYDNNRQLIEYYLKNLYSCAGILDNSGNFRMRTVTEEVTFIKQLQAMKAPVIPVIAYGKDWMVSPFVKGRLLSDYLSVDGPVVIVLRLLYQLHRIHQHNMICGDRWGANELVDSNGKLYLFDFDVELLPGKEGLEKLKAAEMAIALFGCLLHTTRRNDLLECMRVYGISLLKKWGYQFDTIIQVLEGYRDFYINPNKPINPLSPPYEVYSAMSNHLNNFIKFFTNMD